MPDEYPRIVSSYWELFEWYLSPAYDGIDGLYQPSMPLYTQDDYLRRSASYQAFLQLLRRLQQDTPYYPPYFWDNLQIPGDEDVTSEIVEELGGDLERILDIALQVLLPEDVDLKASLEGFFGLQIPEKSVPFQASDCIQGQTWKDDGKRHRKPREDEPPFWVNRLSSRRGK